MEEKKPKRRVTLKEILIVIIVVIFFPCICCMNVLFGRFFLNKELEEEWKEFPYEGDTTFVDFEDSDYYYDGFDDEFYPNKADIEDDDCDEL